MYETYWGPGVTGKQTSQLNTLSGDLQHVFSATTAAPGPDVVRTSKGPPVQYRAPMAGR